MKLWVWVFVIILSSILYWHWGAGDKVILAYQVKKEVQKIKTEISDTGSIQILIDRLKNKVSQTPDDPKGWYLLGNLYLNHYEVDNAIACFEKSDALKPDDIDIMVKYAESLFIKNNKKLNKKAQVLVNKIIKKDLQNINALNLIALDAYTRGDKKKAKEYWEKVLIQLPLDSDESKKIESLMQEKEINPN